MLRDTDASVVSVAGSPWLCLTNRLRCGVQKADRRNPERLAEARALTAISLQVRQSLWGSCKFGSLEHYGANMRGRHTMVWKNFVNRLAITPRRRGLATALVYGLSLAVRFTSAAGEEVEIPARSVQRTHPAISIMTKGAQLPYQDWAPNSAHPIVFRHDWPLSSGSCRSM